MGRNPKDKRLMEGYIGIKFNAIQRSKEPLPGTSGFYSEFKCVCERLRAKDMTYANAGNLSVRYQNGLIITSTGSNLGCLEKDELVYVEQCHVSDEKVFYYGPTKPSSETIMHWLIYQQMPDIRAIIHAHDEFATRPELLKGEVEESKREEPYGSVELARMAMTTFDGAKQIIVLKNHGYVAVGHDLDETCDLIEQTHLRLLSKQK